MRVCCVLGMYCVDQIVFYGSISSRFLVYGCSSTFVFSGPKHGTESCSTAEVLIVTLHHHTRDSLFESLQSFDPTIVRGWVLVAVSGDAPGRHYTRDDVRYTMENSLYWICPSPFPSLSVCIDDLRRSALRLYIQIDVFLFSTLQTWPPIQT